MVAEGETPLQPPEEGVRTPKMSNEADQSVQPAKTFHLKPREFPTMFGEIIERNVIFCIDTSGSMYNSLDAVREHLLEALLNRAFEDSDTTFNLVEFSSNVTQWSDRLVKCTPQTVAVAQQWLANLVPTTGTNTNEALLTAFADVNADAVYLITDGIPDQSPTKVLDDVAYASRDRPVHCFYIQDGVADPVATTFLRDLAMETYGSFHIVTVAQHGALERVTPVYRADTSAERIIRTTDGAIYPSNHKLCSVAPTINTPLAVPIVGAAATPIVLSNPFPQYPHYRHVYYPLGVPYLYPNYGWSRYRPIHAQMQKAQKEFEAGINQLSNALAPGPGSLLIGTEVLARRNEDGYYYLGSVKSQIMQDKFLVEFGPCRHGKFKETAYQETHLCDIFSHVDSLRHPILAGDRVLAPPQAGGEKYAPGVVIKGQERRTAEGGIEDDDLVVSYNDGTTGTVARDTAVWIPPALHQRIAFEHQLPEKVRRSLADCQSYPSASLPGYPTSAVIADPPEFPQFAPTWIERPSVKAAATALYKYPPYSPVRPVFYTHKSRQSAVSADDIERLIPGTGVTKSQLDEKVMSQLVRHNMTMPAETTPPAGADTVKDLGNSKKLDKSVSFEVSTISHTGNRNEKENVDNADCIAVDENVDDVTDDDYEDIYENDTRDVGVGTDSSLLCRRRPKSSGPKPPWRYWKNEPTPSVLESNHYGSYRYGPYEQAVPPVPLEAREPKAASNVVWPQSMGQYVDTLAPHSYDASVRDSMYMPRPPSRAAPRRQRTGKEIGEVLGEHQIKQDERKERRTNFRRACAIEREIQIADRRAMTDATLAAGEEQRRYGTAHRLCTDADRQAAEIRAIEQQRRVRRDVNEELQRRVQARSAHEVERAERHMAALRARRERREEIIANRQREIEETVARRQAIRAQNSAARWNAVSDKYAEEAAKVSERDRNHRNAKLARIEHFHQLELDGQRRKNLCNAVSGQQMAICRSEVLA